MNTKQIEQVGKRHANKIYFQKNPDMDFYLFWILSYQSEKGAEVGECFYAASCIDENKPDSWVASWTALAQRAEARAEEALRQGSSISAREAYLRAFTYYRGATFYLSPRDTRFRNLCETFQSCFRKAASLFEPAIEPVIIPFGQNELPGYFVKAELTPTRRPTLIMVGGGESYCEDLYFWSGAAGQRRGYNVLLVDLPGQGATPFTGLALQANTEQPVKEIVDYLLSRPDVDPERIGIHGLSGGGYFVTRAVAYEHRIRACIANTPVTNLYRLVASEMPAFVQKLPSFASDAATSLAGRQNPALLITLEKVCWQAGADKLSGFLDMAKTAALEDQMIESITCPTLCLAGDGEGETAELYTQLRHFYDTLKVSQKRTTYFHAEDGANSHCQVGNFSLAQQVTYDWLDEVLS